MGDFHEELRAFSAAIEQELQGRELAFPTVLDLSLRIRQVANDPDSTVDQMAALIRLEPVLSARVIRLANSVIYSPSGHSVSTVSDAITRIGMANVRVTALVVAMDQLAQEHRSKTMRDLARGIWAHSVDVGAWAFSIARELRVVSPETALLVGLMTDIGPLYLVARVGQYPAVAADATGFAEIAAFWSGALRRAILEAMELPGDVLDALDFSDPYAGRWPPAALDDVLFVAGLAADKDSPLDPNRRAVRQNRLEAARRKLRDPSFDDLLRAAAPARKELLAVLKG